MANDEYFVGRVVFAKMKGFPPWPAVIEEILTEKRKAKVKFYASNEQW